MGGVMLTPDEISSGRYETEFFCVSKKELCTKDIECYYRIMQVRLKDGACVYLGADGKCAIYEERPQICRRYTCRAVRELFGKDGEWVESRVWRLDRDLLRFSKGLIFAPNPLVKLKAVISEPDKGKLFLMIRDTAQCEDTMYAGEHPWPEAPEAVFLEVFGLFDGVRTLGEIESETANRFGGGDASMFEEKVRRLLVMWEHQRLLVPVHC
jgi:hypothetical protein